MARTPALFTRAEATHAEKVTAIVGPIVNSLALAMPPSTEVVLHDLTRLPRSIVAIAQPVTGRSVGGPPTDLGMEVFANRTIEDLIGYRTTLASGQTLHSSSIMFHAASGRTVAALCINTEIDDLLRSQAYLATLLPIRSDIAAEAQMESFPQSVDELAAGMIRDAIDSTGVPVALMKKMHRVAVVKALAQRGFFSLREAADLAAAELAVTRFSIYNYLGEAELVDSMTTPGPGTDGGPRAPDHQ